MSEPSSPTPPTPVSELPAWLDTLKRTYGLQGAVGGAVIPVWALVFKLKKNQDEVFEISEECRLILERIVQANIQFDTQFSRDGDEIFILLGMDETTLMEEATYYMPLPMKRARATPNPTRTRAPLGCVHAAVPVAGPADRAVWLLLLRLQ